MALYGPNHQTLKSAPFLFETAAPALARYDNYDAARAMDPNEAAGKCECGQCGLSHSRVIPSSSLP
jgi:hypothetical protein